MTRTNAREIACHLVYEMYLNDITAGEALTALMDEGYYPSLKSESDVYEEKPTGKQLEYLENVVQGVQEARGAGRISGEVCHRLERGAHLEGGPCGDGGRDV